MESIQLNVTLKGTEAVEALLTIIETDCRSPSEQLAQLLLEEARRRKAQPKPNKTGPDTRISDMSANRKVAVG